MTISIRRARQRAKTLAADGSLTHQQALDAVAHEQGHDTWSGMLHTAPVVVPHVGAPKPTIPSVNLDPFDIAILSRGEAEREAVVDFMVGVLSSSASVGNLVSEVLVRDRIRWVTEGQSTAGLEGASFAEAVADFVAAMLSCERSDRKRADVHGTMYVGSWQRDAQRLLFEVAEANDMSQGDAALIGMADPMVVAKHLESCVRVLAALEREPLLSLCHNRLVRMPVDFAVAVLRQCARGVVLSEWRATLLQNILIDMDSKSFLDDDVVRRAFSIMTMGHGMIGAIGAGVVHDVFEIEEGYAGMPFEHVTTLPTGSTPTERWLRDLVTKAREGRRPFAFNPIDRPLDLGDREALFAVAEAIVSMVQRDTEQTIVLRAEQLIVDTALVCHYAGPSITEIAGSSWSGPITLRALHLVISRNRGDMGQLSLFAALGRHVDGAAFDMAVSDHRVVELALEALAPF